MTRIVLGILWGFNLVTAAWADDRPAVDAAAFSALDLNEDGVLSGQEVRTVRAYDTDADGEVTRAEFVAGHRRENSPPAKDADLKMQFASKDLNEDDVLSGKEAKGFEQYDSSRDGEITLTEFLARKSPVAADPKLDTPVQPIDPRQQAWNQQLSKQLDQGTRWAVLIGANKYAHLSPLRYCVADARILAETLTSHCGVPQENVLVLTDDQADQRLHPQKINLQQQVPAFLKQAGANDTVLVLFSGHGFAQGGQSFLCPLDFDGESPGLTGWRADELRSILQDCKAAQKMLILDCCHSGGAVTTSGLGASPQEVGGAFATAQGMITLAGCRTNQQSLESEELGHGVFAAMLVGGLAGQADFDRNGIIDSDELYKHVLLTVPAAAQQVAAKHMQFPVRIIGQDVVGVFALARPDGKPMALGGGKIKRLQPGETIINSIGLKLTVLPSNLFVMGSPSTEYLRDPGEVLVPVLRASPILMGAYEVTQSQYSEVMGTNPSWFSRGGSGAAEVSGLKTDDYPVEQVSWQDATRFCEKLSALPDEQATGRKYRLPAEAEWEHACRAGAWTPFHTGELISPQQANIRGDRPYLNSPKGPGLGRTAAVGSYPPNRFGLCDVHGNVGEWCLDRLDGQGQSWHANFDLITRNLPTPKTADDILKLIEDLEAMRRKDTEVRLPVDPIGVTRGDPRVHRGGSYFGDVGFARAAARREQSADYAHKSIGFRVVCELKMK